MEISSREVFYKFFKKSDSADHIFSSGGLFFDITSNASNHEALLTEEEFELNILLMGQFLFNYQDSVSIGRMILGWIKVMYLF